MADEQQTPESARDEMTVQASGLRVDPPAEVKPEQKAEEPKLDAKPDEGDKPEGERLTLEEMAILDRLDAAGKLPPQAMKRIARANRQRDEEKARAEEFDAKLKQAQSMIDALKAKGKPLKAEDFASFDEFKKAKAEQDKPLPEAKAPDRDAEVDEAMADLQEAADSIDEALWPKMRELGKDGKLYLSRAMLMELADSDDPAGGLKALIDAGEETATAIEGMSERGRVKRLREIVKAAAEKAGKPKPDRDPGTGQFRKQSDAPAPINPIGNGSSGSRALDKMSTSEYIDTRNEQEKGRPRFGW
jgi:hypothetical protein